MLWTARNHVDAAGAGRPELYSAMYAGQAAWAVARDMVTGRLTDVAAASEKSVDPEEWDPAYYASLALAGGATWDGEFDDNTRREFWTKCQQVAVPQAYALAAASVSVAS